MCMTNSKVAKSRCGLQYWSSMALYNGWWMYAISIWKQDECYEGRVHSLHRIYFCLTVNMLIDFWLNRRWMLKMGRKYCLPEETKIEFKRIKASKKQMKLASTNLSYVKSQLSSANKEQEKLLKEQ